MAANTAPIFTLQGNFKPTRLNAAYTPTDGTTNATAGTAGGASVNIFEIVNAGTDGTRVDGIRFRSANSAAASTSGTNVHKVFLSDTAGTNLRIISESTTTGATRSTTAIGSTTLITFDQPIIMQSGQKMYVAQSVYVDVRDQYDAIAYAGNY
jgi:hypothetical protein